MYDSLAYVVFNSYHSAVICLQRKTDDDDDKFLKRVQIFEMTDAVVILNKYTKLQCKLTFSLSLIF